MRWLLEAFGMREAVSPGAPPTISIKATTSGLSPNNLPEWIIENFRFAATMKLLLQTFLCWWLLASVMPSVNSAKLDLSSVMKKRLSTWLQSRTKRDLNGMPAAIDAASVPFIRPEDVKDTLKPHSSTDISIRVKRTSSNQSRRAGCSFLPTCTVHDLAHRIHQSKLKVDSAPIDKISPLGYGRRRRSLPERVATLLLNRHHQELENGWVHLVKEEAKMLKRT
ncbi:hypothetical protein AAFF_G00301840 [Aldrovandia affinis]|uniref:Adrenomedullin n=1 Tax=Aldrovandia affinis TaxID=143900 RepID=A0AAD7SPX5_9TELE|nr:hypothetical protein AAFF_G00301840 [Aldrovandia affinis]